MSSPEESRGARGGEARRGEQSSDAPLETVDDRRGVSGVLNDAHVISPAWERSAEGRGAWERRLPSRLVVT